MIFFFSAHFTFLKTFPFLQLDSFFFLFCCYMGWWPIHELLDKANFIFKFTRLDFFNTNETDTTEIICYFRISLPIALPIGYWKLFRANSKNTVLRWVYDFFILTHRFLWDSWSVLLVCYDSSDICTPFIINHHFCHFLYACKSQT